MILATGRFKKAEQLTLGLHAKIQFRMGAKVVREGIKNGGRQKQNYNLGPYTFFTGVNNYLLAELLQ